MTTQSKFIVFVAVLASLLEIIDSSIVNVAIPTMMGNLGATLEDISWVVTGYIIANAIVLPLSAWLGERLGRRKYYIGCIIAFTLTSVACGFAPNLFVLTIFRILQGLAGGALLPISQTLIYEQFPREKAGMAGAIFGMSVMIGPTLGPTLGGFLTDHYGWRSIFNVNLPLGLLAAFVAYVYLSEPVRTPEQREQAKNSPIDLWGLALLMIGIGCLQYMLERGEADDWFSSTAICINAFFAAVCLPAFVWWELRVKHPIINIRLFTLPIVQNGVLLMTALGFFLYGVVFILPIFVNRTFHYDATQTGMLFIPGSMLTAFLMPFVGKGLQKVDARIFVFIGLTMIEVCLYTMSLFSTQTTHEQLLGSLFIRGIAMAFLFIPINSSILSQFTGPAMGQVSGLLNLSRQIGGSIGIALIGTLLETKGKQNYLDLASHVSLLNPQTQLTLQQAAGGLTNRLSEGLGTATGKNAALMSIFSRIQNQVFMMSFLQLIYIIMIIFALAYIPLYRIRFKTKPVAVTDSH